MMNIPLIEITDVWHVGSLDPSLSDPQSYEGCLLSVSTCPDTWNQVARLSGPLWKLSFPNASYVNAHIALEDLSIKKQMLKWGIEYGLVDIKTVIQVTEYDDEMEAELKFSFESYEEAEREYDLEEAEFSLIHNCPVLTDKALASYSLTRNGSQFSLDYLLIDWSRQVLCADNPFIKGIYWPDIMDPMRLSAPRGGIFPDMVDQFDIQSEKLSMEEIEAINWGEVSEVGYGL